MKSWVLSVGAAIIITTIITIILPEGKLGKTIKFVFSIMVMLIMIKPIVYIKNNDFNIDTSLVYNEINYQNDYLSYISKIKAAKFEQNCNKILENNGINNADVLIEYSEDGQGGLIIECVKINLFNVNDDNTQILTETVINEIKNFLNVDEKIIKIKTNG